MCNRDVYINVHLFFLGLQVHESTAVEGAVGGCSDDRSSTITDSGFGEGRT